MSRRVLYPLTGVLAVCACTGALAFWQAGGTGAGQAAALAGPSAVTITGGTAAQSLLPTGAPSGDVSARLTNPNPFSVRIRSLALDTAQGNSGFSTNAVGCALSFATQDNAGAGWTVPAGGTLTLSLADSMTMGTGAATACQGRTFSVYMRAG